MTPDYVFRPMTSADLPLVRRWLAEPHVVQWWGDPAEQYDLVSGDLDEPAMDQFIVSAGSSDFAYLQCYDLTAWNSGFGEHPRGTRGIDQFIGEHDRTRPWFGFHSRLRRRAPAEWCAAHCHRSRSSQHPGRSCL